MQLEEALREPGVAHARRAEHDVAARALRLAHELAHVGQLEHDEARLPARRAPGASLVARRRVPRAHIARSEAMDLTAATDAHPAGQHHADDVLAHGIDRVGRGGPVHAEGARPDVGPPDAHRLVAVHDLHRDVLCAYG